MASISFSSSVSCADSSNNSSRAASRRPARAAVRRTADRHTAREGPRHRTHRDLLLELRQEVHVALEDLGQHAVDLGLGLRLHLGAVHHLKCIGDHLLHQSGLRVRGCR
jgi:hypothetical protein